MLGIIDIKITWCATKSIIFFSIFRALLFYFFIFLHAFSCKQRWCTYLEWCSSLWLKLVKNKDQCSRPFSQARNAGNEVAIFLSGHYTALKNLSELWKTVFFKLSKKQQKILNQVGHYNSFFFCSSISRYNEGRWMLLMFSCYLHDFFTLDYKQLLIKNRLSS